MNKTLKLGAAAVGLATIVAATALITPRREPQPAPMQQITERSSIPLREALELYIKFPHKRHYIQPGDQLNACAKNEGLNPPYVEAYVLYVENLPVNRDSVQIENGSYIKAIRPTRKLHYDSAAKLYLQLPDVNQDGLVACQQKRVGQ